MPRDLPKTAAECLTGRNYASNISEALLVAFYFHDDTPDRALFHYRNAHDELLSLANALGYDLVPRPENEATDAI